MARPPVHPCALSSGALLWAWVTLGVSGCLSPPIVVPPEDDCAVDEDCTSDAVCEHGQCVTVCSSSAGCEPYQRCDGARCRDVENPQCMSVSDCTTPGPCETAVGVRCQAGRCEYLTQNAGISCDDGDRCTTGDACNASGVCVGTPLKCNTPPANACNATDDVYTAYASPGTCNPDTGLCEYTSTSEPCPSCETACRAPCSVVVCDELRGGCRTSGVCVPGPPVACDYTQASDTTSCHLVSTTGVCLNGECVGCTSFADCAPTTAGPAPCFDVTCVDFSCEYLPKPDVECGAAVCTGGYAYAVRTCGADGGCPEPAPVWCNGYQCASDGVSCLSICTGDQDCMSGLHCQVDGTCKPGLRLGASCGAPGDCNSGNCVDGVCCNDACAGPCRSCGADGQCVGNSGAHHECGFCQKCSGGACVPQASEDVKNECDAHAACGTGLCNGAGGCDVAAAGAQPSGCSVCQQCDGGGNCVVVPWGEQRPGCDQGQITCSYADTCDGQGSCNYNHMPAGDDGGCGTCWECDGGGGCRPVGYGLTDEGCQWGGCYAGCDGFGWCMPGYIYYCPYNGCSTCDEWECTWNCCGGQQCQVAWP